MTPLSVDCRFLADGTVQVRRVNLGDGWLPVESGRQWHDERGRHVLIRLPGGVGRELRLDRLSLTWLLSPGSEERSSLA